jgi:hypothetical protein
MNADPDRRKPPAPHCYRVVQLGLFVTADRARTLAQRTSGRVSMDDRTIEGSSLFEPKVGGGGHLLLFEDGREQPWARVLVEPDGPMVNLVAAVLDGEWETSDETLVSQVRCWLNSLHSIPRAGQSGAATDMPPGAEEPGEIVDS